jgi:histidinol-phosphate aminotransferase
VTAALPASPLLAQPPAPHGGDPGAGIDLSASLNPLGAHPAALAAARACSLGRYPEPQALALAEAAAERHRVKPAEVVPIPGAATGIWLCCLAFAGPGSRAVLLAPSFGEHERCLRISGAAPAMVRAWPPPDRVPPALEAALGTGMDLCLLANPSTPSGRALPAPLLRALCADHPATLCVVDEAFAAFAPPGTSLLDGPLPGNAVVIRSLTKELGLPGLRMGYMVAAVERAQRLRGLLPAWPLSAPALAAAVAGLADPGHADRGAEVARLTLSALRTALERRDATPLPSDANYLVVRDRGLSARLRARGIRVRDCASFGLPDHARISAPSPQDLAAVLEAIDA